MMGRITAYRILGIQIPLLLLPLLQLAQQVLEEIIRQPVILFKFNLRPLGRPRRVSVVWFSQHGFAVVTQYTAVPGRCLEISRGRKREEK